MNRSILAPSLLALSLSLTGCVTGGNIKGDFQCSAPGGTCAPMSTIDAAAISGIGSFRSIGEPGIEGQSVPRGIAGPVLADGTAPARTGDTGAHGSALDPRPDRVGMRPAKNP